MSSRLQRARPQMIGPCTSRATAFTLSQSPREAAGKPASMTSTPRSASARATRSFSGCAMLHPGDCSPSRSVVSKIMTRSRWDMGITSHERRGLLAATLFQPRHAGAQFLADLLELVIEIGLHERLYSLRPPAFSAIHCLANLPFWISLRILPISFLVLSLTMRGPRVRSPYLAVSEMNLCILVRPPSCSRSTMSFSSCRHS